MPRRGEGGGGGGDGAGARPESTERLTGEGGTQSWGEEGKRTSTAATARTHGLLSKSCETLGSTFCCPHAEPRRPCPTRRRQTAPGRDRRGPASKPHRPALRARLLRATRASQQNRLACPGPCRPACGRKSTSRPDPELLARPPAQDLARAPLLFPSRPALSPAVCLLLLCAALRLGKLNSAPRTLRTLAFACPANKIIFYQPCPRRSCSC